MEQLSEAAMAQEEDAKQPGKKHNAAFKANLPLVTLTGYWMAAGLGRPLRRVHPEQFHDSKKQESRPRRRERRQWKR